MSTESNGNQSRQPIIRNRDGVFRLGHDHGYRDAISQSVTTFEKIKGEARRIQSILGQLSAGADNPDNMQQLFQAVAKMEEEISGYKELVERKKIIADTQTDQPLEKQQPTT